VETGGKAVQKGGEGERSCAAQRSDFGSGRQRGALVVLARCRKIPLDFITFFLFFQLLGRLWTVHTPR
jgi:hypothetical protein